MIARRERLSFAAGDLGFNFVWQSTELYLLFFYISVLGLSAEAAAAIFFVGTIVDWVADPVIGVLVDRLSPRVPVRMWVLLGGPLSGLALAAVFAQPLIVGADGAGLAYALVAHIILRFSYSLGNIPYGALTSRISDDPLDRIILTGARMQGAALGGLIATAIFALLALRSSDQEADFLYGALLLVVLAQPAFLATYFGVRERVSAPLGAAGSSRRYLTGFVKLTVQSSALRRLLAVVFAAGLSITVLNKSILFLFQEIGSVQLGYAVALLPSLSLLISAPLWVTAARKFGPGQVLLYTATANLLAVLALPAVGGSSIGIVAVVSVAVIAGSGMSIMFWSLAPDVVDGIEHEVGATACAARVFASVGIARKLAQALAPQFVTLGLLFSSGHSVAPGIVIVAILTFGVIVVYRPRNRADAFAPV